MAPEVEEVSRGEGSVVNVVVGGVVKGKGKVTMVDGVP